LFATSAINQAVSLFPVKLEWALRQSLPSPKVAIYRLHLTLQEELKGLAN